MNHGQWRTAASSGGSGAGSVSGAHGRHSAHDAPLAGGGAGGTFVPHDGQQHHVQAAQAAQPVPQFKTERDSPVEVPSHFVKAPQAGSGGGNNAGNSSARPILQSCQFCRKRKIKCDKLEGGCSQCSRAQTECVYPVSQRKGRPRKPGSKHNVPAPTPREEQLLKKIWKLEAIIEGMAGRGGQGHTGSLVRLLTSEMIGIEDGRITQS
jgi:hypothetical protein